MGFASVSYDNYTSLACLVITLNVGIHDFVLLPQLLAVVRATKLTSSRPAVQQLWLTQFLSIDYFLMHLGYARKQHHPKLPGYNILRYG